MLSGVVFSFGAIVFRAAGDVTPWQYLTLRGLGAASVTALWFLIQNRGRYLVVVKDVRPSHVLAGVLLGLMMSSFIVALSMTTAAFIMFLQSAAPITAAAFSWFLLGERMSRPAKVATCAVAVGVLIMIGGSVGSVSAIAVVVASVIPIGLGLYTVLLRREVAVDPSIPAVIAGVTACAVGLAVSLGTTGMRLPLRETIIGFLAGAVLLGAVLPLFNVAQPVVRSPEVTLLLMTEVVLSPLWVWIWPGENPGTSVLLGGLVILVSVVWLTVIQRRTVVQP